MPPSEVNRRNPTQQSPSSAPKVLLISASVGAGHNAAARALLETISAVAPHLDVTLIDSLDFTSRWFRAKYAGLYALAVSRFPRLYGLGYALTDRPKGAGRTLVERWRLWSERRALGKLADYVRRLQPDLIVHTHFLAPSVLWDLSSRGELKARQLVVTTDVQPHRWWYCKGVEHWFTGQEVGQDRLRGFAVDAGRITVSGIPIHPKWTRALPQREELLARWSLPADKKIVLLSGGTDFTCGPVLRIARGLAGSPADVCLVVLAGRNKRLLARLSKLPEVRSGRVVPMGFTDRLNELSQVASLMVTKAGGLTTAECLSKSTPMVFLKPVPGQERVNAEFFAGRGAGLIVRNPAQVVQTVCRLLDSPAELDEMARNAGQLYRPGARTITEFICRLVSS